MARALQNETASHYKAPSTQEITGMNKLLQVLVCGLAAVSFSAIAADEADTKAKAGASVKADKKKQGAVGGTKADAKADVKADTKTEAAPAPAPVTPSTGSGSTSA